MLVIERKAGESLVIGEGDEQTVIKFTRPTKLLIDGMLKVHRLEEMTINGPKGNLEVISEDTPKPPESD